MEPTFSTILLVLFIVACLNYLWVLYVQRLQVQFDLPPGGRDMVREGFTDLSGNEVYLRNDQLYDSFYASVYDQLTQNNQRTQAKVGILMGDWKKEGAVPEQMSVLDAGGGTGVASILFASRDVGKVICLDSSQPMLKYAKETNLATSKLSDEQKKRIEFRLADLMSPSALGGGSVSHAVAFYFTIYYLPDVDAFFRNMFLWVKPGGRLAVEVVNKYKFDPMLESASPWIGFSLQKYSKERMLESRVAFNKFNYAGKFELNDPEAEFRETFQFKDGKVRRQRHRFRMPSIEEIVKSAQAAGWVYTKYVDLTTVGFEYAYLLSFRHP